jgi:hypothetical protein
VFGNGFPLLLNFNRPPFFDFQLALKMLQQSKTLTDPLSLDNSCLVNREETANTWPLICDPQHVAQSLVTALNQVTIVKFKVN